MLMCAPNFIRIKRGLDVAHKFILNNVPVFAWKSLNFCKPLLLRFQLVIPQCLYKVSLGLKKVQMGAHDFKLNKVPLFAKKPGNSNTSMSAALKLALVPASRYYCDVNWSYHNVCAKFH